MAGFQQLSSARPALWASASAEWSGWAGELGQAAAAVNEETRGPIAANAWTGLAAAAAADRIAAAADALEAAEAELGAISDVLQGMAEALTVARDTLAEATALAARSGIRIGPDGTVSAVPVVRLPSAALTGQLAAAQSQDADQVRQLITTAVRQATQADQKAAAELDLLARHAGTASFLAAYNTDVDDASRTELEMITGSIPKGPPGLVSRWWSGLPVAEQKRLMLAAPATLAALPGIPASVQAGLRGTTGVDRVKLVQYALDNWNNTTDDVDTDNCTNFVSDALAAAGMRQQGAFPLGRTNSRDDWYKGPAPFETNRIARHLARADRSYSWADAADLHTFLTSNNSKQVPYSQAQPGDIMFFQRPGQGIYHSVVVTAVVDGLVYYTQHTPGQVDADWSLRQTLDSDRGIDSRVIVVQPAQPMPVPTPKPW